MLVRDRQTLVILRYFRFPITTFTKIQKVEFVARVQCRSQNFARHSSPQSDDPRHQLLPGQQQRTRRTRIAEGLVYLEAFKLN